MPKPDEIALFREKPATGVCASEVDEIANIVDVARQIGAWVGELHNLERKQLPTSVDDSVIELDKQVEVASRQTGSQDKLADPYSRYSPAELIEKVTKISSTKTCPTHGAPKLSDFTVSEAGNVMYFNVTDTLAYRRPIWDLASLQLDITALYGAGAVFEFYEGYGSDPSLVDLDSAFAFTAAAKALDVL